jgi:hypothetical protein
MTDIDLQEESNLWRSPPLTPYRRPEVILILPTKAIEHTLAVFRMTAAKRVEACCFWYGVRSDDGTATVLAIVVPKQRNSWGNYFVQAAAVSEMAAVTRPRGWLNLSQVHTHPGASVEHSRFDDGYANSRRALSMVFPFYGRWQGPWPVGVGIHEFQDDYWHQLSEVDAALRVIVTDAGDAELLDLR